MVPRIEYDNPFMIGRPDGIARVEKPRQEDRRRRNGNQARKQLEHREDEADSEAPEQDLGKRIDLEA
mgnify:CR=1 FL=1